MKEQRPFPLIEFAQSIGKNTAELTVNDLGKFMKEWIKQKPRKDLLNMSKRYNTQAFQAAQMSRLPADRTAEDIEEEVVEVEEMTTEAEGEVVCEVGFTQEDIDAVVWALNEVLTTYDFEGNDMGERLQALFDNLEGLRTQGE